MGLKSDSSLKSSNTPQQNGGIYDHKYASKFVPFLVASSSGSSVCAKISRTPRERRLGLSSAQQLDFVSKCVLSAKPRVRKWTGPRKMSRFKGNQRSPKRASLVDSDFI